jgi:hypothetical protein
MENQHKNTPDKTPKNSETLLLAEPLPKKPDETIENPYKADVFEAYVTWKALPVFLKNPPPFKVGGVFKKPDAVEYAQMNGIEDEELLDLISIPSQSAFAERFGVSRDTLTDWNKSIKERDPLKDTKRWSQKLISNLMMSLYSHAMKKGDARNFKLFFQVSADFEEKQTMEHKFIPINSVEIIEINHENKASIEQQTNPSL